MMFASVPSEQEIPIDSRSRPYGVHIFAGRIKGGSRLTEGIVCCAVKVACNVTTGVPE